MGTGAPSNFCVRLRDSGASFEVAADQTLLQAAECALVTLPSSCRNGTCRTCLSQLVEGAVRYRIPWPGLSAEEKIDGWCLPCVAYPATDLVLAR